MTIYNIESDANSIQWIIPEIDDELFLDLTTFDCKPKLPEWPSVKWYIHNPKSKKGDFYTLGVDGALVFNEKVYDSDLAGLLEMAGEILPVQLEDGTQLYILNVLECVNALDKEKTTWHLYDDGSKRSIKDFVFHSNRITESSLFKIPETSKIDILVYSGVKDPEDEFKTLYEKLGFTGLTFKELYSSEK